jgi:hypothetical protein
VTRNGGEDVDASVDRTRHTWKSPLVYGIYMKNMVPSCINHRMTLYYYKDFFLPDKCPAFAWFWFLRRGKLDDT